MRRRYGDDSGDEDKSPRSEDTQSYINPGRDDQDIKTKMSEMNEEKRSKLREIEVLNRSEFQLQWLSVLGCVALTH